MKPNLSIESNIRKMYAIRAIDWFLLMMPTVVLFFQENGLSMKDIFLLQAAYALAIVVFEMPTGYFADAYGRKLSLIVGAVLAFFGMAAYSFSYTFWGFLAAEILMGIGSSFTSGADSALLYDTLLQSRKEKSYKSIEGKYTAIGNFSEGTAAIIGGFLALLSLRVPLYAMAVLTFFAIPIALSLQEPKRKAYSISRTELKGLVKTVKYALNDHKELKWLILYYAVIGGAGFTMVWLIQPYFKAAGLPLAFFGIVWALLQFSAGYFSLAAGSIERFFGRKASVVSLIFLSSIGFVLASYVNTLWAIAVVLIFYFVRGIIIPIFKDYINRLISSDIRATVLSVQALMARLAFSITGPIIGWVSDSYGMQTAFKASSGLFLLLGVVCLLFLKKHDGI